jgi:tRNA-specific 2-thiouridylase
MYYRKTSCKKVVISLPRDYGFIITKKSPEDPRYFVIRKDLEKNTVTVASKESESNKVNDIKGMEIANLHFSTNKEPALPYKTKVRIRYRQEKIECKIDKRNNIYIVLFNTPQNAIAVGQSAVFYDDETCIGGGIIEKTN